MAEKTRPMEGQAPSSRRFVVSNTVLLILAGLAAVVGGYWLPAHVSTEDNRTSTSTAQSKLTTASSARPHTTTVPPVEETEARGSANSDRLGSSGMFMGKPQPSWTGGVDLYRPLWRLALATTLVLAIGLIFIWILRRYLVSAVANHQSEAGMQVRGEISLGGRCRLVLVRVGQDHVLVGLDARGISTFVALPVRFSDVLEESAHMPQDTPRQRRGAVVAAMVGEEREANGA
ncbi:MAG: flagellar biosynthetic protein FliO [Gemmatales bacterium]|nr:flagellar biosynthetic protein FliO [Gemmatales bacterium]MDW7995574.1 flagellar biosynthetic protein FliO [Gemmatales bacterium]